MEIVSNWIDANPTVLIGVVFGLFFGGLALFLFIMFVAEFVHNRFRYEHRLKTVGWIEDEEGRIVSSAGASQPQASESYYNAQITESLTNGTHSEGMLASLVDALYAGHFWMRLRKQGRHYSREQMELIKYLGTEDELTTEQIRETLGQLQPARP